MPGRKYSADNQYRYGFNGKENENEMLEKGNSLNFEARIYDPRTARWYSLDPLQKKFPGETHYGFVSDNPIIYADIDGRDKIFRVTTIDKNGETHIYVSINKDFFIYTKVDVPGFGNSRYYKNDLIIEMVIDQRSNKVTYKESLGNRKQTFAINYYYEALSEWASNKNSRGSQSGGITLTSQFSSQTDGPKTDITTGTDGSINIDLITAAFGSISKEAKGLKWEIESAPGIMELAKDLVELHNAPPASPANSSSNTKQNPVEKSTPPREGGMGWDYYIRDKNGKFVKSKRSEGLPDSTVKGQDGRPDTIYKRPFKIPPIPKKDIKGK